VSLFAALRLFLLLQKIGTLRLWLFIGATTIKINKNRTLRLWLFIGATTIKELPDLVETEGSPRSKKNPPAVKKMRQIKSPNISPVLGRSKLLVAFFAAFMWLFLLLSPNINKKEPSVSGSSSVPPRSKNCPIW